ncbi:hypothetical protein JOF42_001550 [Microbacterium phyllosphaerae]|uniref:Uncharacterized protein n=1 Tax=Microbacterium phyllosphaerae TaxID=124798 RepID=A0ABS4WPD2_9MICO|nr:hypothetical protein [Microbacterium phyllosphaerae]MBP2378055.1 hypothetical protein [Microbacterium phyllosphaerae]
MPDRSDPVTRSSTRRLRHRRRDGCGIIDATAAASSTRRLPHRRRDGCRITASRHHGIIEP